jgi:hypothetical protein
MFIWLHFFLQEDVKYGHNLESLATTYSTNFMSPFTTLKYVSTFKILLIYST